MKIVHRGGGEERQVLTAMIVDVAVLGRVASTWDKERGLFASRYANLVGGWCVDFYLQYGAAPQGAIQGLYASWASSTSDEETSRLVESLLAGLSEDYEAQAAATNTQYVIDTAGALFNRVRVQRLIEELQGDLDGGRPGDARKRLNSWGQVELGGGAGVDIFHDEEAVLGAFKEKGEPLVTWPGPLGQFFRRGVVFERDCLVSFIAPEKRGKTWWLMEVAWQGVMHRRNVAMFQVGDMSQDQMIVRYGVRAARHPGHSPTWPLTVKLPISIAREPEEKFAYVADFKEKEFHSPITGPQARAALAAAFERTKTDRSLFKLSTHPNDSITVAGIASILKDWERTGWVPDIVVIDYADIIAPMAGMADTRDQINSTWKRLRALSQSLHCCVVTATQADAASYSQPILTRANFNNDKRVNAHCTAIIGINQTNAEKEMGIQRLNYTVLRDGRFNEMECVHVGGCLEVGLPARCSCW